MTDRAEGFWWVRWEGEADEVAEVVSWAEHARRLGWSFDVPDAPAQMLRSRLGWTSVKTVGIEWGPYLGKEPSCSDPDRVVWAALRQFLAEQIELADEHKHSALGELRDAVAAYDARQGEGFAAFDVKPDAVYKKPRTLPDGTVDLSTWEPFDP